MRMDTTRCINESSADVPLTDNNIEDECVGNDGKTENFPLSTDSYGTSLSNAVLPIATASSDVKEASYLKVPYTENTDSADTAHTGGDASIEHNLIILDNPDWRNLEESCIFIDVGGCHSDALSWGKLGHIRRLPGPGNMRSLLHCMVIPNLPKIAAVSQGRVEPQTHMVPLNASGKYFEDSTKTHFK